MPNQPLWHRLACNTTHLILWPSADCSSFIYTHCRQKLDIWFYALDIAKNLSQTLNISYSYPCLSYISLFITKRVRNCRIYLYGYNHYFCPAIKLKLILRWFDKWETTSCVGCKILCLEVNFLVLCYSFCESHAQFNNNYSIIISLFRKFLPYLTVDLFTWVWETICHLGCLGLFLVF